MSNDVPPALVARKREHLAAEAELNELSSRPPRAIDIATREAKIADEDQRAWDEAWRRAQDAAVAVQLDPWWSTVDDRRKARQALMKAARES